jgi:hypothetical protein
MSNQDKKIKNFREFYDEEDDRPNKKKQLKEYKKDRFRVKQKLKNFDPNNFAEDELDDLYE